MRIRDLVRQKKPLLSLEFFPPKKAESLPNAEKIVEAALPICPDFISVTFGGGSAHLRTIPLAAHAEKLGLTSLAHMTCTLAPKAEIPAFVEEMKQTGIQNILALRGDRLPGIPFEPETHHMQAVDLIADLKNRGDFCIGAACHPEGHIENDNRDQDLLFLKEKVDAGCDFLTTQMFFDNHILYKFLLRIREMGIHVPVFAGVMPVTNKVQIRRLAELTRAMLPARFSNIIDRYGDDPDAMRQAGIAYATEQIVDLYANGISGVHIYTMNRPEIAATIAENLSSLRG